MCRSTGNADVRYGLSATWTARAGLDRINRDSSGNLTHPYARLTGLFTNALSVDLRATYRALLGAEFAYQPSVNRRAALSYTVFDTGVESPLLTSSGMRSQLYLSGFYRPQRDQSRFFVQWNGEHTRRIASTFSSLEVVPSIQTRQVRYMPRLRIERAAPNTGSATTRSIGALSAFALLPPSWGSFWARMAASTNVELDLQSMQYTQANLSLITRLRGNRYLLSSSVSTSRGVPAIISLTLQTNLQALRGLTQSILQGGAPFTAIQTTQGSVVYNRLTNSTSFVAGPSLQRAGVTGTVFLDENSNGAYDVGEELLADVFVRAASGGATTDSLGRFEVWDIPTFTQTVVALDAGSLESPLWIPAVPAVTIEPGPNHYRPLSMAVVPGGSIDGIVVRKSGEIRLGLPGVRVTLTNTATREQQHQSTFADGGFSFLSVRPGRYVLTVDEHLMTRYAGTFSPVEVEVESLRDGALVEGVELAIETAPPPVPVIIDPLPQAPVDSDGDGVMDPDDRCPGTPAGVRVDVTGCALLFRAEERTVTLRGVNFRTGSAELTRESLGVLDSLAATLLALPDIRVEIGGHTDNTGSAALNQRLSLARARSVMQYLSSRGVPLSRMSAVGYGPRIPVAPNNTAEGRAQNRRVELRRIQ
jgi:outer membrane protein OmpA-like peptidoglycan-associated protein